MAFYGSFQKSRHLLGIYSRIPVIKSITLQNTYYIPRLEVYTCSQSLFFPVVPRKVNHMQYKEYATVTSNNDTIFPKRKILDDHRLHWTMERVVTLSLLGIIPATFLYIHANLEFIMAFLVVLHMHWGLETITVDYVRASVFGKFISNSAVVVVYLFSIAVLVGLLLLSGDLEDGILYHIVSIWRAI